MKQFIAVAVVTAALVVAHASPAGASPISFCSPGSTPCTGVELSNPVSGFLFSYDTGGQTFGPFEGEQAIVTPTTVGIAAVNRSGGDADDSLGSVSAWFTMERIVITGGTGTDTIFFDWSLDGTLSNGPFTGVCSTPNEVGCTASVSYVYGSLFGTVITSSSIACCTPTTLNVNESGSFGVAFTYGVPFTPAFYLKGGTGEGAASLNFLSTGDVTAAIIPFGATLTTLSGNPFGVPVTIQSSSPVPEPASLLLTLGGLAGLAARRRRMRNKAREPRT